MGVKSYHNTFTKITLILIIMFGLHLNIYLILSKGNGRLYTSRIFLPEIKNETENILT